MEIMIMGYKEKFILFGMEQFNSIQIMEKIDLLRYLQYPQMQLKLNLYPILLATDGVVPDVLTAVNFVIQNTFLLLMEECMSLINLSQMPHPQIIVCNQRQYK